MNKFIHTKYLALAIALGLTSFAGHAKAQNLYVGDNGSDQTLTFTSDTNSYLATYVGHNTFDSNNLLEIDNTNTLLTNSQSLYIGYSGSFNNLVISNGGQVLDGNVCLIGNAPSSASNSVLVTGSSSLLSNNTALDIGFKGSGNSLVISSSGQVVNSTGYIGNNASSLSNSVLVTGSSSRWSNAALNVGYFGGGTLTLAHGGSVTSTGVTIANSTGSVGTINIGSLGGSDTAGIITAPTIAFGSGNGTINFNQSDTASLTSSISGLGTLKQLGSGTTILTGNNSYTGTTTVSSGTLLANNTSGSAFGTSSLLITNAGTLGGNGTIGGATRIASGGSLTPGSTGSSELTFTAELTLETGSTTTFLVNSSSNFTSINLVGSSISYGGALVFNLSSYLSAAGDEFTLFNMSGGASPNGDFSSVEAFSNESGFYFAEVSGIWSANNNGFDYQFDPSNGTLLLSLVPEPSSYALFGLGVLAMVIVVRRRKA